MGDFATQIVLAGSANIDQLKHAGPSASLVLWSSTFTHQHDHQNFRLGTEKRLNTFNLPSQRTASREQEIFLLNPAFCTLTSSQKWELHVYPRGGEAHKRAEKADELIFEGVLLKPVETLTTKYKNR